MKFAFLIATFAASAAAQVFSGSSMVSGGVVSQAPPFFYYVDTVNGNDAASGRIGLPWKTVAGINSTGFSADTIALAAGQIIAYKTQTGWEWYRSPNMTADRSQLTIDLMTGTCNAY